MLAFVKKLRLFGLPVVEVVSDTGIVFGAGGDLMVFDYVHVFCVVKKRTHRGYISLVKLVPVTEVGARKLVPVGACHKTVSLRRPGDLSRRVERANW
jgi:hypothetical protein